MAMDTPSYDELLFESKVEGSAMKSIFEDDHLRELASELVEWELLAKHINLSDSEIEEIKYTAAISLHMQKIRMLEYWKQKFTMKATYEAMAKALLKLNKTRLAQKVMSLRLSPGDTTHNCESEITANQSPPSLSTSTSPAITSGMVNTSTPAATSLSSLQPTENPPNAQDVAQTLEQEFLELVIFIEETLEQKCVLVKKLTRRLTRRFSMLPESIRRQHHTDENYTATRQKILESKTIKDLFDKLTELKHWNYMLPDTLKHIVQLKSVDITEVHLAIEMYESKLKAFKRDTKLKDVIHKIFPVPDYYAELHVLCVKVDGWEDVSIEEADNRVASMLPREVKQIFKTVEEGCIQLIFILTEYINLNSERVRKFCEKYGVTSIRIDGEIVYSKDQAKGAGSTIGTPSNLWYSTHQIAYQAVGGRDVLIVAPDLSLPHPKAVARRPGQLTEKDKPKLQSQGVPPDFQDELDIVKARHQLDKRHTTTGIKSGQSLSREDILENIAHLLTTTQNDGVVLHYIGAGRKNTGDWCFEDGFITFRDITELYLRASHNFKYRVLTIISDCSYSGCWVRDCMEFLDEQGVQPCGHKARERGMIIKVLTSCKSNEIPTKYRHSVSGIHNNTNTGLMAFYPFKKLVKVQTTDRINSSLLICKSKTIDEPCTLPLGLTWSKLYKLSNKSIKL